MALTPLYTPVAGKKANVAAFMSGSGTNVLRVLELENSLGAASPFYVCVIVTDKPSSNAKKIAYQYDRPLQSHDIKAFYRELGLRRVCLRTQRHRDAREAWTDGVRRKLEEYRPDFGVFGGFEPLTNLVDDMPCVNIHPEDLSYKEDSQRVLVGLYTVPILKALERGLKTARSSAILATPYTGDGSDMDDGPLLALGPEVEIPVLPEWMRRDIKEHPDAYEPVAKVIQNWLKIKSDWETLPPVVRWVAEGRYARGDKGNMHFEGRPVPNGVDIEIQRELEKEVA